MDNWIRSAALQIGPYQYTLDGMHFSFSVPFEDTDELACADIEIKNLSEGTRRGLQKGHVAILNAGYEGDVGVIFKGQIANLSHKWEGTEWTTKIQAIELMDEWLNAQVNKTYRRDILASDMIADLANIGGFEVARAELTQDIRYPSGYVCAGPVHEQIYDIAVRDCQSQFMTRTGQIHIFDPANPGNVGPLLSPATGLLRCDEDMEMTLVETDLTSRDTREEKDEAGVLKNRACLLNYRLGPGEVVMIRSKSLNGRFQIVRGKHSGDPRGDWKTEIEVKPI